MAKTSVSKQVFSSNGHRPEKTTAKRLEVLKTYKIYIGGQFPRTESGRYYIATNSKGEQLANVCLSSRKDVRDAVVATNAEARLDELDRRVFPNGAVAFFLVLGLTAACVLYFVRTQSIAPSMDDLMPGYSERRARQTGIIMGGLVVELLQDAEKLKEPLTQAVIIAVASVLAALLCFRVAWLMDRPADTSRHPRDNEF